MRSGYYKKLNVLPIKEGELISYDPLTEDIEVSIIQDAFERENAKTVGYYAMFEYLNGFRKCMYWTKDKMLAHADRYSMAFSKDGGDVKTRFGTKHKVSFAEYEAGNFPKTDAWMYSSFWYKDFDGMAMKTMLRQLISKWGVMSTELETAYLQDTAEDQTGNGFQNPDFLLETDPFNETGEVVSSQTADPATGEVMEEITMDEL